MFDDSAVREQTTDPADFIEQRTPVRVAAGSPWAEGERLRISVETTRNGYLYVLGRAVFANGAKGGASLLFPAAGQDNHLAPGGVIQIPGTSSFKLTRERGDQVNETLTFLILSEPVAPPLNSEKIVAWEGRWKTPMRGLEEDSQIGRAITRAEMHAGADRSILLTSDDALPQTMFQCRTASRDPVIFDVSLPVQKGSEITSRDPEIVNPPAAQSSPVAPVAAPPPAAASQPPSAKSPLYRKAPAHATTPPAAKTSSVPAAAPAPSPLANPPSTLGGFSSRLGRRVTASDFLVSSQTEKEGYGLYSYILFGARPESPGSDRWRRYYEAIVAYLDIPTVGEVSRSVPPESTNLTFLPLAVAASELPAGGLATPIQFRFDSQRLAAHEALHKASGKQFPYHDSSTGATACMLVGNYDYARAQGLLAVLPNSHMEGPYIISVAEPLSRTRALPPQYLYQDLSSVPPELIRLWVKEFMAQAQENEFWKTRSKDQFVLRLRTAIGVMSQQIPDFGKSITWTFISVERH